MLSDNSLRYMLTTCNTCGTIVYILSHVWISEPWWRCVAVGEDELLCRFYKLCLHMCSCAQSTHIFWEIMNQWIDVNSLGMLSINRCKHIFLVFPEWCNKYDHNKNSWGFRLICFYFLIDLKKLPVHLYISLLTMRVILCYFSRLE